MRLLLAGGYCGRNPGDEAILKSTLYRLDAAFPGSEFLVWSSDAKLDLRFDRPLNARVFRWRPLTALRGSSFPARALTKLYVDGYPHSRRLPLAMALADGRVRRAFQWADKLVLVGGGYLSGEYALPEINLLVAVARSFGKPVVLLGQTLGPYRKPAHVRMAREIFEEAERIVVREEHSLDEVAEFRGKVSCGADDAIGFDPRLVPSLHRAVERYFSNDGRTLHLGVNVRERGDSREFYPAIADAIEAFASRSDLRVKVIFVPMETTLHSDDRRDGRMLGRHLSPALDYRTVGERFSVEQTYCLISRLDLFVGMRLHSLVFALGAGVPSIGLYGDEYYRRKIDGLFRGFGLEDYAMPLAALDALPALLERIHGEREGLRRTILAKKKSILLAQQSLLESAIQGPGPAPVGA